MSEYNSGLMIYMRAVIRIIGQSPVSVATIARYSSSGTTVAGYHPSAHVVGDTFPFVHERVRYRPIPLVDHHED